ncbi:MAG: hypothetical protein PHQ59_05735 [Candidatus Daviesbacteria bacterium]|nr:hypothetical protein [Candidatus Daviesbacteria bacterium]
MKNTSFAVIGTSLTLISFLAVSPVFAQYLPPTPTPTFNISINKTIFNPQTQQFVDNLTQNQFSFIPDQTVDFRIEVKNTGDVDLNSIDVTDQLPSQLDFVSGGTLDKGGQPHFSIDKLAPSQTQSFLLKTKIRVDASASSVICPVNLAKAQTGALMDQDTSTFCINRNINKKVAPVEELPKTGLPLAAWSLVGFLPAGFGLKRFSKTNKENEGKPLHIWQRREFEKES